MLAENQINKSVIFVEKQIKKFFFTRILSKANDFSYVHYN